MARNPSISIGFSQNKFAQEVNKMATELKAVKKEFEVTNLAIEATGDKSALAQNKLKGFAEQAKILRNATDAMQRGLEGATNTQAKLAARVEAAKQAYERSIHTESKSKEQVEKLKKEYDDLVLRLNKADKAVANWGNKLRDAQIAENKLKIAVNQTNKEIEEQNKKQIENINSTRNVTSATGQLLNVYTLIKGLALGYAGRTLFEALIGDNAQFEQYMANFEVLLGGYDNAQKRMAELTRFAADTPFELPQIVEAEKRLLAYGVAAQDTAKVMQMLGDLSMGNAEKMNMLSLAYGQVVTATRLTGGELRQFSENGIPLLDELAKMYNVTAAEMREMVSDGQISADAVTAVLQKMTSEGGKFYGMMEKQSQTMQGMLATLKDNVGMFAREVGQDGFEYLKNELQDLMREVETLSASGELSVISKEWGRSIAQFIGFVVDAVKTLYDMRGALVAVGAAFAMTKVISGAIATFQTLRATTLLVKAGFDAAKVSNDILKASLIKSPWGLVAAAIGLVVGGLIAYNLTAEKSISATGKLQQEIKDITSNYESAAKAAQNLADAELSKLSAAEELIPELDVLAQKTKRTEEENTRLNYILSQLNKAMPDLALAIDNETGALSRQINTVYEAVNAYKDLAKAKAVQSMLDEAEKTKYSLTQKRDELATISGEEAERFLNARSKAIASGEPLWKFLNEEDADKFSTGYFSDIQNTLDELDKEIAALDSKSDEYAKELSELQSKRQGIIEELKATRPEKYEEPPPLLMGGDDGKKAADKAAAEAEKRRQQAIQQEFKDLKFAKNMEYITEEAYYKKLAELRDKYYIDWSDEYRSIALEIKKYNDDLLKEQQNSSEKARKEALQVQKDAFQERRKFSDEWIADQKFYNKLTADEEIAAYERIREYIKEYYKESIIDEKEYRNQIRNIDREIYAARKKAIEDEIKLNINAQKKILDAQKKAIQEESDTEKKLFDQRKKAIEDYYDEINRSERQAERSTKLSELYEMEKLYQNAVTVEGKDRLREIRDEIRRLNQETEKEQRDLEKNAKLEALEKEREMAEEKRKQRLEAISREYENLDSQQQAFLENIATYAALTAGTLEQVTDRIKSMLDALNRYSNSLSGFENIGSGAKSSSIYNLYQTNNNNITDAVSANVFGSYITSGTMRFLQGVGR